MELKQMTCLNDNSLFTVNYRNQHEQIPRANMKCQYSSQLDHESNLAKDLTVMLYLLL